MDALTFQVIREGLGHTRDSMASELSVREKTIRLWEYGDRDIPDGIADIVWGLVSRFNDQVDSMMDEPVLVAPDRQSRAAAWAVLALNVNTPIRREA